MAESSVSSTVKKNRLMSERSPYLLQHATNPVDWYPWGEEAFRKAESENKPIFLSVGYSTCHWCHVMERESFHNQEVADILNHHFVSIKVDREERPDVDHVYMTFIQATQGRGGWPMSVFLTPDLKPFFGGTYFPPKDSPRQPGFITLLDAIKDQWATDAQSIRQRMEKVMGIIKEAVAVQPKELCLPGSSCIQRAAELFSKRFDSQHGGFGDHPKFPQPIILDFLLRVHNKYPSSEMGDTSLDIALTTLRAMANGGIYDHVGQGFHRYSTDREWHVPHFEKMLYDQAQMACVYTEAFQASGDKKFSDVAQDILSYVMRDMTDKDGGFYSAEDADSFPFSTAPHKKEGAFCVWTWEEVIKLLDKPVGADGKKMADLFGAYYGMKPEGNVDKSKDPHGELKGQNVLIIKNTVEKLAQEFHLTKEEISESLSTARRILYDERQERPKPHRDDKIITSWNGLMISAFARAGYVLGDHTYLIAAEKCADFIRQHMYRDKDGVLLRSAYRDDKGDLVIGDIEGFADDYSSLISALLDLYESSHAPKWLEWAMSLQETQDWLFWDSKGGGYFSSSGKDKRVLIQMKEDRDGAEPSPNSLSALNLLRLSTIFHSTEYRTRAEGIFKNFNEHLNDHPGVLSGMVSAFIYYISKPKQIIVVGERTHKRTQDFFKIINSHFDPHKMVIFHDPADSSPFLTRLIPELPNMKLVNNLPTVHVCEEYKCHSPTNDLQVLKKLLKPQRT